VIFPIALLACRLLLTQHEKSYTFKTLSTWHNERNIVTAVVELPPAYTHINNAIDRQMAGGNVITGISPLHRVNRTKLGLPKI